MMTRLNRVSFWALLPLAVVVTALPAQRAIAGHGSGTCVLPDGRNVPCSHSAPPPPPPVVTDPGGITTSVPQRRYDPRTPVWIENGMRDVRVMIRRNSYSGALGHLSGVKDNCRQMGADAPPVCNTLDDLEREIIRRLTASQAANQRESRQRATQAFQDFFSGIVNNAVRASRGKINPELLETVGKSTLNWNAFDVAVLQKMRERTSREFTEKNPELIEKLKSTGAGAVGAVLTLLEIDPKFGVPLQLAVKLGDFYRRALGRRRMERLRKEGHQGLLSVDRTIADLNVKKKAAFDLFSSMSADRPQFTEEENATLRQILALYDYDIMILRQTKREIEKQLRAIDKFIGRDTAQ